MKQIFIVTAAAALAVVTLLPAGPKADSAAGPAAYSRLKNLAGEWEAAAEMGKLHLNFELISGGTALVERISGEKTPPMMTVYYLDGGRLLMTHYCMLGNQPRMQAKAFNAQTGEIDFDFLDATNLAPGGRHMHRAKFHLTGNDRLSEEWQLYEDNQPAHTETFEYTRVK